MWGILAPSAHNKQPWHVEISGDTFRISPIVDTSAPSDPTGRQAHIGVGCFTANIVQAINGYGFNAYCSVKTTETGLACVQFECPKGSAIREVDFRPFKNMLMRQSNRGRLDPNFKLSPKLEEEMQDVLIGDHSSSLQSEIMLRTITDPITLNMFAGFQEFANGVVIQRDDFREELSHHFMPNNTTKTRVMPGDTFLLPDKEALEAHKALSTEGQFDQHYHGGLILGDSSGIRDASAIGILVAPFDDPKNWIQTGIALEKIWLFATEHELAMAVMAGVVEVNIANRTLKMRLLMKDGRPTAVFRIGKGEQKTPHSPRIAVPDLFQD